MSQSLDLEVTTEATKESGPDHFAKILVAPLAAASIVLGAAAGHLAEGDLPVLALLWPVLLLPVILWRFPRVGVYLLFAAAIAIEQFEYEVGPRAGAATGAIPVFQGALPAGVNLAEVLVLVTGVVVVMQAVQHRTPWFHRSQIRLWLMLVLGLVVGFLLVGISRGGDPNVALWEIRPYFYLASAYVLASALIDRVSAVRPLLWIIVLGSSAKAVYGLVIFQSIRHLDPRPEAVLAHEESFLFGLYVFVTAALWLFGSRGRLRVVATFLLPVVLLADMVNSRRTAWLILISGLSVLLLVALVSCRERRKPIAALIGAGLVGTAVYLPVFWNQGGTLAQPARAVRSIVAPDARDEASNQYREIENYNLSIFINDSRSLGTGFGQKLDYFGLVDLTDISSMLAYVPHNGVLYLWLRLGILGVVVFSIFLAQAMISAVRLSAAPHREAAMTGAIAAAALMGYTAMGVTDLGFTWFRNAFVMGILLGAVDGLFRQIRREDPDEGSDELDRPKDLAAATGGAGAG